MGTSEAFAFATAPWGSDRFGLANATIEYIIGKVKETDIPIEFVSGGDDLGPFGKSAPYLRNRKQEMLDELASASEMIDEVCQVCQRICAEIP